MNTTEPKNSAANRESDHDVHTRAGHVPEVIVNASRTTASFIRDHWLPIAFGAVGVAAIAVTWSLFRRR